MIYCVAVISDVHSCFVLFDCESDRNQQCVSNLNVYYHRCVNKRRMKKTHSLYTTFYYRKPSLGYNYMNSFSYFWNTKPDNGLSRVAETCSFWIAIIKCCRNKWVPVTTAWRVLSLRMEERLPIWRVGANILNKQSRTADKGWSSSLGVRRGANNSSL